MINPQSLNNRPLPTTPHVMKTGGGRFVINSNRGIIGRGGRNSALSAIPDVTIEFHDGATKVASGLSEVRDAILAYYIYFALMKWRWMLPDLEGRPEVSCTIPSIQQERYSTHIIIMIPSLLGQAGHLD